MDKARGGVVAVSDPLASCQEQSCLCHFICAWNWNHHNHFVNGCFNWMIALPQVQCQSGGPV